MRNSKNLLLGFSAKAFLCLTCHFFQKLRDFTLFLGFSSVHSFMQPSIIAECYGKNEFERQNVNGGWFQQKTLVMDRGLGTNIGEFLPLEISRNVECESRKLKLIGNSACTSPTMEIDWKLSVWISPSEINWKCKSLPVNKLVEIFLFLAVIFRQTGHKFSGTPCTSI